MPTPPPLRSSRHPSRSRLRVLLLGIAGSAVVRMARTLQPLLYGKHVLLVPAAVKNAQDIPSADHCLLLVQPPSKAQPTGEPIEMALREKLLSLGRPHSVIYGDNYPSQLAAVAGAITSASGAPLGKRGRKRLARAQRQGQGQGQRPWSCDCCADPASERALFTRLLAERASPQHTSADTNAANSDQPHRMESSKPPAE